MSQEAVHEQDTFGVDVDNYSVDYKSNDEVSSVEVKLTAYTGKTIREDGSVERSLYSSGDPDNIGSHTLTFRKQGYVFELTKHSAPATSEHKEIEHQLVDKYETDVISAVQLTGQLWVNGKDF